ncbi:heat-inducible transcriptional repressor HrcA [Paenibacillus flagellatus]|uniref:Heat-inducible transcription repressor HrcA n=1 Tax=Paenibacillus flagellatus TaxID=2211139 RepID=A0A2V5KLW9_9BACL|nr:heat-inducible transcriptional repressor HrcA [Paenibacillus flagellatus]PYI51847.1 heat-inducible transcriptional repressor HrcA [Paenibacillus flagellatus]
MLTERQKLILSAIVDDYIRSAEPVGSRTISKRGDVGFSPATIRNEMSDLEELGFLEQPHTSAGRIPSHKGYRYYVDHLVKRANLSVHELDVLKLFFAERLQEMESIIQHVATVLSGLTNYTSIVMGPELMTTTLKHLQIVPLNDSSAVAIIVTNTGHVENRVISIPEGVPVHEIEKIVNLLNARLAGVPLIHFKSRLYNEVGSEIGKYVSKYEELIRMIEGVVQSDEEDRIYVSGSTNMLTQPEFKDVDKVKGILDLFDEAHTLVRLFSEAPPGIQVKIGTENSVEAINNCSLITASYSIDGQLLGTIGILGPTRMEYGKVINLLDHLSKDMAVVLARWYK